MTIFYLIIKQNSNTDCINNKDDILCKMCDRGEVGDEAHFRLRCDAFSQERSKYLRGKYPSTSSDSIKELMTTKSNGN